MKIRRVYLKYMGGIFSLSFAEFKSLINTACKNDGCFELPGYREIKKIPRVLDFPRDGICVDITTLISISREVRVINNFGKWTLDDFKMEKYENYNAYLYHQ